MKFQSFLILIHSLASTSPFKLTKKRLGAFLKQSPPDTSIIVSHGPIKGMLDSENGQTGFDVKKEVKEINPKLFISGHIHQSFGFKEEKQTLFLNASFCSEKKIPANPLWVLDWQGGIKDFHQELPLEIDATKVSKRVRYGKIYY